MNLCTILPSPQQRQGLAKPSQGASVIAAQVLKDCRTSCFKRERLPAEQGQGPQNIPQIVGLSFKGDKTYRNSRGRPSTSTWLLQLEIASQTESLLNSTAPPVFLEPDEPMTLRNTMQSRRWACHRTGSMTRWQHLLALA